MPATRPTDLQQWQYVLPRGGWVDVSFPLAGGEGGEGILTTLYNMRVTRDGLETVPGWSTALTNNVDVNAAGNFVGVVPVQDISNEVYNFFFFTKKIYMWRSGQSSWTDVTPSGWTGDVISEVPEVVLFNNKFYMAIPHAGLGGVYELDPQATSPQWTLITNSPKAKTIANLGFRLVVGYLVKSSTEVYPYRIQWSGLNNPTQWDDMQTLDLPTYDAIMKFAPLREHVVVITPQRFFILAYTGNPLTPFAVQFVTTLPGTLTNKEAVLSVGTHDVHMLFYALGSGLYAFTGNESVLLSGNIDLSWKWQGVGNIVARLGYNPAESEIYVIFDRSAINAPPLCFVYQLLYRTWYQRDVGGLFFTITHSYKNVVGAFVDWTSPTLKARPLKLGMVIDQRRDDQSFNATIELPVSEIGPTGSQKTLTSVLLWWTTVGNVAGITGQWKIGLAVSHHFVQLTSPDQFGYTIVGSLPVNGVMEEVSVHYTGRYLRLKLDAENLSTRIVFHGVFVFWH